MSESIGALTSPPVRTVSKSNVVSPLSSPGNSVLGSPRQTGMSVPYSDPDSRVLSDSATSPPPVSHGPLAQPPVLALDSPSPTTLAPPQSHVSQPQPILTRMGSQANSDVQRPSPPVAPQRRASFGLSFLSSLSNTIRGGASSALQPPPFAASHTFMSNSPTIANLSHFAQGNLADEPDNSHEPHNNNTNNTNNTTGEASIDSPVLTHPSYSATNSTGSVPGFPDGGRITREETTVEGSDVTRIIETDDAEAGASDEVKDASAKDKDDFFSVRLTPIIDHSSSNTGLYFSPVIRRIKPKNLISIGRYTEKNKSAAHAPQGSLAPVVFKSKVVSRTHAMFQCNEEGLWFLKDCKSSSGTFLNNIRLSQASQELTLWPLIDGDIVQLGLDYRGGTEEVYRCVKMRCEFNRSWQRKVNRFNLDIHKKMANLGLDSKNAKGEDVLSECAICLLKLEPCQALFISPCSHSWHYKCIRPIIIKSYPQFYCPNCRSMCDLETDIEDED